MRAKYTIGPAELTIGDLRMEVNRFIEVPKALEKQVTLPDRVKEYGIKIESGKRGASL